jgi:phosphate starvation-inducible PhoH-like protein
VKITARGNEIILKGEEKTVEEVFSLFQHLISLVEQGEVISEEDIFYFYKNRPRNNSSLRVEKRETVFTTFQHRPIKPKTPGQQRYLAALKDYALTFCIGPAGTGKTYLAVATAIASLKSKEVERIILARPAIEAGESLGYLPGDLLEKVDPYFRPLYDALYDMLGTDEVLKLINKGVIEVAPLAYMRGRTLNNSFIILDEAQNTTVDQMKMFLTRIGFFSKTVVTGDITQIDLPTEKKSGLVEVQKILKRIRGIKFIYLSPQDVIRHQLVKKIIKAYEKWQSKET